MERVFVMQHTVIILILLLVHMRGVYLKHIKVCVYVCVFISVGMYRQGYILYLYTLVFGLVLEAVMSLSLNETDVGIRLNKGNNL